MYCHISQNYIFDGNTLKDHPIFYYFTGILKNVLRERERENNFFFE